MTKNKYNYAQSDLITKTLLAMPGKWIISTETYNKLIAFVNSLINDNEDKVENYEK